jgi:hypothetical protein
VRRLREDLEEALGSRYFSQMSLSRGARQGDASHQQCRLGRRVGPMPIPRVATRHSYLPRHERALVDLVLARELVVVKVRSDNSALG